MSTPVARISRRRVDGVLLLDKQPGLSSNAALQRAKRIFGAAKAGHTGTLDPLATGLLPVCFGDATKFAQALLDSRKCYVATIRFGVATTTGDAEGEVIAEGPPTFRRDDLERVVSRFLGVILQVPPRHAALKYQGRPYYEYARAGVEIERRPREARIDAIDVVAVDPPLATIRVACGKGTYVRVLAEDIAIALGTVAHLHALRRTEAGPFSLAGAVTLEAIAALPPDRRDALLLPVDAPLARMAVLRVDTAAAQTLSQGRMPAAPPGAAGRYRCTDPEGRFLGLVEVADGLIRAVRLVRMELVEGDKADSACGS